MMFVCSVYLSLSIMTLGIMTLCIMSVCPWQAKTMAKNILKGNYAKNISKGKYDVCLFCLSVCCLKACFFIKLLFHSLPVVSNMKKTQWGG